MSVCFGTVFEPLTLALRAVEVFIRDKYERKRFYNQEALAAAPVSTGVFTAASLVHREGNCAAFTAAR